MADKRIGSQTPSQSFILSYSHSKGTEAVDIYESSGRTAYDWQKLLEENMMAVNDDGLWTHQIFGYEVPRQNGKGEVLAMRELWGLLNGENIIHTAHKTSTSHSAFVRLVKILADAGFKEMGRKKKDQVIPEKSFKSTKQYGLEQIMVSNGGSVVFRTRTEAGGIGESFDCLIVDEAQEYTSSQQAALMFTIAASPNPQTIFCGTPPTQSSKGDVFAGLRKKVLAGKTEETGWAEWSSYDRNVKLTDTDAWYQCNPSLGLRLTERTIRAEVGADSELDFRIQRLGYWHSYELKSEITEADWMTMKVERLPALKGKLYAGIRFGADGVNVSMSIAVKTADGMVFLETIDCQPQASGFGWMISFLKEANVGAVAVDGKGKSDLFSRAMEEAKVKIKPIIPTTAEAITAYSGFRQAVDDETIRHCGQPSVVQAISNCEKRFIGSNGAFGFRSIKTGVDVSIVESMALAHWLCVVTKERRKQKIGY